MPTDSVPSPPLPDVALTPEERQRYLRHLILPAFGATSQLQLKRARVLIIGLGGLGSPTALYLAAAGIGQLGLVDFDDVDHTNLQRQIIHQTDAIGTAKLDSAAARIKALNPNVKVTSHPLRLMAANAMEVLAPYDVIVDGTDNFPTRYLINDACVLLGKPNVQGSIFQFEGQLTLYAPGGPCYRCCYPEPPPADLVPNCGEAGVLGILPGVIGTLQATEVIKWITGIGTSLQGRLLLYNALDTQFRTLQIPRDPDCPVCGSRPSITALRDLVFTCDPSGPPTYGLSAAQCIDPAELRAWLAKETPLQLLDVREPEEHAMGVLPGSLCIPLGELERRHTELNADIPIVAICKSGGRSAQAVRQLSAAGIPAAYNLVGGIDAWNRLA